MKNLNLNREINLNKKFIILLVFVCILSIGLYSSYAYFQISVIKNNVVVIKTASIDITTEVVGNENQTFTLNQGETKNITVNLTSTASGEIGYKMYYDVISGISLFQVTSTETFTNDIVEGVMNQTKAITFTFQNTGDNDLIIKLGTQGGLTGYPIPLEQGIELVLNKEIGVPVKNVIINSVNNPTNTSCKTKVEEDGITYISGTKDCIDFNYVWYSGKLWRITAIYPDGTMKMITDDAITTISYGSNVNFYTDESNASYMYQWLNEDFLDTLYNYENIIVMNSKWNTTISSSINTKLPETTMVTAPVGLLNSYEYYMSYKNTSYSSGYLNIGYYWWLLNPYSSSNVWLVSRYGNGSYNNPSSHTNGARPSIHLKSTIQLIGGTGTKSDPYRISGDKEEATANTTLLNTRTSGEYVTFDGELYRIVSIEDGKIKINKNDYVKDESNTVFLKNYSNNTTWGSGTTTDEYWDYYLNHTWYNGINDPYKNMIVEGTYYLGTTSGSYKGAICKVASNIVTTKDCEKTTSTWSGFVGLPRYGEMFASQQGSGYSGSSTMWLMSPYFSSSVWDVNSNGNAGNSPGSAFGGRPSIHLKSGVKITGGNGTKEQPFEISL